MGKILRCPECKEEDANIQEVAKVWNEVSLDEDGAVVLDRQSGDLENIGWLCASCDAEFHNLDLLIVNA